MLWFFLLMLDSKHVQIYVGLGMAKKKSTQKTYITSSEIKGKRDKRLSMSDTDERKRKAQPQFSPSSLTRPKIRSGEYDTKRPDLRQDRQETGGPTLVTP